MATKRKYDVWNVYKKFHYREIKNNSWYFRRDSSMVVVLGEKLVCKMVEKIE